MGRLRAWRGSRIKAATPWPLWAFRSWHATVSRRTVVRPCHAGDFHGGGGPQPGGGGGPVGELPGGGGGGQLPLVEELPLGGGGAPLELDMEPDMEPLGGGPDIVPDIEVLPPPIPPPPVPPPVDEATTPL